jgi:hypothetical protein
MMSASMNIHLRVFARPVDNEPLPGVPGPGKRFVFSNDLALVSINGIPQSLEPAATHSGFLTTLRVAGTDDNFYPPGSYLIQYEGTYRFNAVPDTTLQKGQVTARGVLYLDRDLNPLEPPTTVAITGGTDAYVTARGQITEPNRDDRELDIQL